MDRIKISIELNATEAEACAQTLKRATFGDFRSNATSDEEAHIMIDVSEKIRGALIEKGFNPR
jgi:hypothetical protein